MGSREVDERELGSLNRQLGAWGPERGERVPAHESREPEEQDEI